MNLEFTTQQGNYAWYAIYVRSRHEKKVHKLLIEKGIESSLPLIQKIHIWSDRKKKVNVPLFNGYVFVHIYIEQDKFNVLKTDGVVKFIGVRNTPSRIPDNQIMWINLMVNQSDSIQSESYIPVGQRVCVITGPMKGIEGIVITRRNKTHLVVQLDVITQAVSIIITSDFLEIIEMNKSE